MQVAEAHAVVVVAEEEVAEVEVVVVADAVAGIKNLPARVSEFILAKKSDYAFELCSGKKHDISRFSRAALV
jgi:hypothetical protein